jgi:hypothetical protein
MKRYSVDRILESSGERKRIFILRKRSGSQRFAYDPKVPNGLESVS